MTSRRRTLLSLLSLPVVLSCNNANKGPPPDPNKAPLTIAVIPKGTTHEFWKAAHAGAAKAAKELKVNILWKGPLKEDDLKSQIDIVQSMVAQGVAGIVLAPLNDKALVNPVKAAKDAKIPVVIFDSDLQGTDYASFIATDNLGAGRLAAEHVAKLLSDKGKVIMLRYQEGSASTALREQGFSTTVKEQHKGLSLVSDNQYGGATTESAFAASENLLAAQKASEGGVDAIFCPNESTTFGMLLALRKANLAGKIKLVGFDASEKLLGALREGHVDALVVQNPFAMGEGAVRAVVAAISGNKIPQRQDTGVKVVTKADLDDPAVKELLHPDLKTWLGE